LASHLGWPVPSLSVRAGITHLTRRDCNEKNTLHRGGEKNT